MAKLELTEKEWIEFKKHVKHPQYIAWDIQGGYMVLIYRTAADMFKDMDIVWDARFNDDDLPMYMISC